MRELVLSKAGSKHRLHITTPLGVVNIVVGLRDFKGRAVDSIEVIPCSGAGEQKVIRRGLGNTRLIQLKRRNA